jgi:hypothetical protein
VSILLPDYELTPEHGCATVSLTPEPHLCKERKGGPPAREHPSYDGIEGRDYRHYRIRHQARVYVAGSRGQIHTQTIEGFWSLVKRGIGGVYHSVSKDYLQSYLNEYSFRYNRRDSGNLMFYAILARVAELASQPPVATIAQNQTV